MKKTKGNTLEKSNMPEGFEQVGSGNLAPFFDLSQVGQSLRGILERVRFDTQTEKVKVKGGKTEEVEKKKYYFDIQLTEKTTGDDATKLHRPITHEKGERITLSGSGVLKRAFMDAALKADGKGAEAWPTDGTEPDVNWALIQGLEVYVERIEDRKMGKKSRFPGNKVKGYTVGVKFNGLKH